MYSVYLIKLGNQFLSEYHKNGNRSQLKVVSVKIHQAKMYETFEEAQQIVQEFGFGEVIRLIE